MEKHKCAEEGCEEMVTGVRCRPHNIRHMKEGRNDKAQLTTDTHNAEAVSRALAPKKTARQTTKTGNPNPIDRLLESPDLELFFSLSDEEQRLIRNFKDLRYRFRND